MSRAVPDEQVCSQADPLSIGDARRGAWILVALGVLQCRAWRWASGNARDSRTSAPPRRTSRQRPSHTFWTRSNQLMREDDWMTPRKLRALRSTPPRQADPVCRREPIVGYGESATEADLLESYRARLLREIVQRRSRLELSLHGAPPRSLSDASLERRSSSGATAALWSGPAELDSGILSRQEAP
jgi:hypothetical protein